MSVPTLLLDTNILWNRTLCRQLTEQISSGQLRVCVPTLVHAERIRQIADHYGERYAIDVVRQFIEDARFELLPLSVRDAEAVGEVWLALRTSQLAEGAWAAHRFDILLCAIAHSTGFTLISDDTGGHFDAIPGRMRTKELESWLQSHV